jgi:hypothetical protein
MTRDTRTVHVDAFREHEDFGEQLYGALRQSPWWVISLVMHVMAVAVAMLFPGGGKTAPPAADVAIEVRTPLEEVDPPEPPPADVDPVPLPDTPVVDPVPVDHEQERPETDVDELFDSTAGDDGQSTAALAGPSHNPNMGVGGSAGNPFGRPGKGGNDTGGQRGGSRAMDDAVEHALRWLAAHQSPDGGWEAAGFDRWCDGKPAEEARRPTGLGKVPYDPGVTGLALCAFLGAGYTTRGNHAFRGTVSRGLRYLRNLQDPEGCFGPRAATHYVYNHATAALAMVEAYGMTESPILRAPAQKALDFIAIARNPYQAWRYGVKPGQNDTSVTGWMMMALKSAKLVNAAAVARGREAPLVIDDAAFDGIRDWIGRMTDPDSGRVGYMERGGSPARPQELVDRFPPAKSESMTAVGVLARVFLGENPRESEMVKKGAALMAALPPTWEPEAGTVDMYYWYYATLAMYQVGGDTWKRWTAGLEKAVVATQRMDGDPCTYRGSWDPIDPWGADGGRVYSTAVLAMCLQIHSRYPQVFGAR